MNWSFITGAARKLPCTKIILFPIWIVIESGTTMADPKLPSACITLSSYGVAVGGSQAHFLCFFKCAVTLVSCIMTFQNPITIPLDPIIAALISLKSFFVSQRRIIFSELIKLLVCYINYLFLSFDSRCSMCCLERRILLLVLLHLVQFLCHLLKYSFYNDTSNLQWNFT